MGRNDVISNDLQGSEKNQHSPRSGKRLLWFLVIPVVLAASAFFGAQARTNAS
jgi:hypothetical protein